MDTLHAKYDRHLRTALGYRAVWEPGAPISVGNVVAFKDGVPTTVATLEDFGIPLREEPRKADRLNLSARGVNEILFQAGVPVPILSALDPAAPAELRIQFRRSFTYQLRATELSGGDIANLVEVGRNIAARPDWRFGDYYVVWRILVSRDFTFFGSREKNCNIALSGSGRAIADYLTTGVSGGISRTSRTNVDLEIIGAGGPVALGVTRISKDGWALDR
jgi:hypothetical protein